MHKESTRNLFNVIANYIAREAFLGITRWTGRKRSKYRRKNRSRSVLRKREDKPLFTFKIPKMQHQLFAKIFKKPPLVEVYIAPEKNYIDMSGLLYAQDRRMIIGVDIPKFPIEKTRYEELYKLLYETIRHEVEHAAQGWRSQQKRIKYDPVSTYYMHEYEIGNLKDDLENFERYLTDPEEVEAYCVHAYYSAKKNRIPLQESLSKTLNFEILSLLEYHRNNPVALKEINAMKGRVLSKWIEYLKARFPASFGKKEKQLVAKTTKHIYKESTRNLFNVVANKITRAIFEKVISGIGYRTLFPWRFYVFLNEIGLDHKFINSITVLVFTRYIGRSSNIGTEGIYFPQEKDMQVRIGLPSIPLDKRLYKELHAKIYRVVRHEIEHAAQTYRNVFYRDDRFTTRKLIDFEESLRGDIDNALNNVYQYLTCGEEVEAYVTAAYYHAKKYGDSLSDRLNYPLFAIKHRLMMAYGDDPVVIHQIDNMLTGVKYVWMEYLKRRFPKAKLSGNWYKMVKEASPLVSERRKRLKQIFYRNLGHDYKEKGINYLWCIDEDYNLHTADVFGNLKHSDWDLFDPDTVVAHGRYDKKRSLLSMTLGDKYYYDLSRHFGPREYIKNQVVGILDRFFDNPTIVYYD